MKKLNHIHPTAGEEATTAETNSVLETENSSLLNKVRLNYRIFGGISLIFGIMGTLLFYKTGLGLNSFLFTLGVVILLTIITKKLEVPMKQATKFCYLGSVLLGLSNMLTASLTLQFLNSVGILLLLEVALIIQFCSKKTWDFTNYLYRMANLPIKSIASIGMPFIDCNQFLKKTKLLKNDRNRNILIGVVIAIPFLLIISALLSSADLLFGSMTKSFYKFVFSNDIYLILLMIIAGYTLCYSILCATVGKTDENIQEKPKADPVIAITITILLLILYILFCGIQTAYLFAGGLLKLPVEFTYAEYARRGFFELLAVTCFNLLLILFCMKVFWENRLLKALLTAITACTYIMIASASYRMLLYIGAYHLTFLRLIVLLFLLIDSFILAGIIISVYKKQFPLFGYCVTVISICYLIFSFSKPDYIIADYYFKQTKNLNSSDLAFLTKELSYDAAPVVIPVLQEYYNNLTEEEREYDNSINHYAYTQLDIPTYYCIVIKEVFNRGIRDYNLSYSKARYLLEQYPLN